VIDEVLFELFSEFGTECFDTVNLFGHFLAYLDNFFIYVPAQEMGSFC